MCAYESIHAGVYSGYILQRPAPHNLSCFIILTTSILYPLCFTIDTIDVITVLQVTFRSNTLDLLQGRQLIAYLQARYVSCVCVP